VVNEEGPRVGNIGVLCNGITLKNQSQFDF
jgi:hypothetical protein